jgi:endonuclease I
MENTTCKSDQLEVKIRASQNVRFKAGSELSSKVNRVVVDVNEDSSVDHHITEISIQLFSEDCVKEQQD